MPHRRADGPARMTTGRAVVAVVFGAPTVCGDGSVLCGDDAARRAAGAYAASTVAARSLRGTVRPAISGLAWRRVRPARA
jgi:hypothetical protein